MRGRTEKKMKHLRRRSVWPSLVFLLAILIVGILFVSITVSTLLAYMIEGKYIKDRAAVEKWQTVLADEYQENKDTESILREVGREPDGPVSMCIFDENNVLLDHYGNIIESEDQLVGTDEIEINLFFDEERRENGWNINQVNVDINKIFRNFLDISRANTLDKDIRERLGDPIYTYHYWIAGNLDERGTTFYVEMEKWLDFNDCLLIIISAAISSVVLLVMIIICLFSVIHQIRSQRYAIKLLLMDQVTEGNNFLAFENYARKELTKWSNRKNAYAILDFSLLKYQSYCSLYGTAEGERLLIALERCLQKYVKHGEIHARVANADYALMLKVNGDRDKTIARVEAFLEQLPAQLKNLSTKKTEVLPGLDHLKFKTGIYFLDNAVSEEGKARRNRKTLQVNQLYIKAGMAKNILPEDGGLAVYNHEMWEKEVWERKVEDKMQTALDREEFQVYIQPKYHPSTEELVGGEALVRWISPEEGFISPGQFIPIFEKTGFVTKLDDYMISHTAKLQADWLAQGKKIVPISVNVSRAHFAQPDLAEHIKALVDVYPLPHKYIEIELTESAFFDDKNALLKTVKKLQEYEFEVSMDDFGSGYSSLNSLKDLPLDVLKLDAEFFRGDDFDTRGEIVVAEAISLAKQLHMKIVAEGIEKKEHVDFLAKQDCDMIQGYYFAKPMPAAEYQDRMSEA